MIGGQKDGVQRSSVRSIIGTPAEATAACSAVRAGESSAAWRLRPQASADSRWADRQIDGVCCEVGGVRHHRDLRDRLQAGEGGREPACHPAVASGGAADGAP